MKISVYRLGRRVGLIGLLNFVGAFSCLCGSSSETAPDSEAVYQEIAHLRHTQPDAARERAKEAYDQTKKHSNATVADQRLRLLYADILIERGKYSEVYSLLNFKPRDNEIATRLLGAQAYLEDKKNGSSTLAEQLGANVLSEEGLVNDPCWKAEISIHYAQTLVELRDRRAETQLNKIKSAIESCIDDKFWSAYWYLVLGNLRGNNFRYQQEFDAATSASQLSGQYKLVQLIPLTNGNVALASVHLGDFDGALSKLGQAERWYSPDDKEDLALDIGHRARAHHLRNKNDDGQAAIRDYKHALDILKNSKDNAVYQRNLEELTAMLIESGQLNDAEILNLEALRTTNSKTESWTQLSSRLNEAVIARLKNQLKTSLQECRSLVRLFEQRGDPELNWRLHSEMAQTLDAMGRQQEADREYKIAVDTADKVRQSLGDEWSEMTFSVYVQKLVALYIDSRVRRNDAGGSVQIAETFRSQRLAEKLHSNVKPAPEQFRKIAAARRAVILSYWINGDQSYLWATTGKEIKVFRLQGLKTLDNELADLDTDIGNHKDLLQNPKPSVELYKKLVKPAEGMIPREANVIIVPDGPLGKLNFEMLIPDTAKTPASYWINQVSTVVVAPSLALLQNESNPPKDLPHALLAGDPLQRDGHPQLGEINDIKELFSDPVILTGTSATPKQFLDERPGEFAVLHISAHATANQESPLDSFVEFTDGRLYAHDLKGLHLKETLVTLSACQGANGRSLPGEGVVGLTWAILSAGARNVVASAPNVPVQTTRQFMKDFYKRLKAGATPAKALHDTKVTLAKTQPEPYYWAGFQLYTR